MTQDGSGHAVSGGLGRPGQDPARHPQEGGEAGGGAGADAGRQCHPLPSPGSNQLTIVLIVVFVIIFLETFELYFDKTSVIDVDIKTNSLCVCPQHPYDSCTVLLVESDHCVQRTRETTVTTHSSKHANNLQVSGHRGKLFIFPISFSVARSRPEDRRQM